MRLGLGLASYRDERAALEYAARRHLVRVRVRGQG